MTDMFKDFWSNKKKKGLLLNVFETVIVLMIALLVLLPIWWIFRSSLMSTAKLNEYPPSFIPISPKTA